MAISDSVNTVLLVSGYRNGDLIDYHVKETSFMFDLAAGGAAIIVFVAGGIGFVWAVCVIRFG